jgi:hypothetical protein
MTSECSVCLDDGDRFFKCMKCKCDTCKQCMLQHIETTVKVQCPKCKTELTERYFRELFGVKYVEYTYRPKKEKVLFDKEMARIPETQQILTRLFLCRRREPSRFIPNYRANIATSNGSPGCVSIRGSRCHEN